MTASEFRATLAALEIGQSWLADQLGVETSTVNRWATGKRPVPGYAGFALELLQQLDMLARALGPHYAREDVLSALR